MDGIAQRAVHTNDRQHKAQGYGFEEKYLEKSQVRAILSRMLKNLLAIYAKADDSVKIARVTKFIEILGGAPREEGL